MTARPPDAVSGPPPEPQGEYRPPSLPWRAVNPEGLPHVGYSNAVVSRPGTWVSVAGQIDMGPDGRVAHPGDLLAQAEGALSALGRVLAAAGARPEHLVRVRLYVTDAAAYATHARAIGRLWRAHLGRWFPALSLVEVAGLYDAGALIEIEADAVIPDA